MKPRDLTGLHGVLAASVAMLSSGLSLEAATVSWVGGSGDWNNTNNWSTGFLPGTNDDVVLDLGPSITVTHSSGTHFVRSVQGQQLFVLAGGSLTVSNTFQTDNTFTLSGGTLRNAQLMITSGASLIVGSSGTLDGVTLTGMLDVGNTFNNVTLTVTNGLTLNGTALVGNATNRYYGQIQFAGSQTLGGSGTVVFGNQQTVTANALRLVDAGTTLTIGPGITIEGQNGAVGYSSYWGGTTNVSVVNQGTISASVSGGTITVAGAWVLNQNLLSSASDATLTVSASLTNTGIFNAGNSAVFLGGTLTLANLGTFNASNVSVYLTGVFDNSNTTVSVNALGGTWLLNGGEIDGGAVIATNGASLAVSSSGTLNGVTVNGTLDVGSSYDNVVLTVTNGLTLNGTALVGNATNRYYGQIQFAGSQTLGGSGTVVFGNQQTVTANALRLVDAGTTLTIGPGITIEGQNGAVGYSSYWGGTTNVSVVNQGTISASVSGGTITVAGAWVLNQNLLSSASDATLTVSASLTNTGIFNAGNSAVFLGGTLTLANLGTFNASNVSVYLTGVFDNSNTTVSVNALGGTWLLAGGEIDGGAVIATNGASLVASSSGVLNGVTVNGTLDVGSTYDNVILTVTNGLTLNGTALVGNATNQSYGQIDFGGSQTLGGSGTVVFGNNSLPTGNVLRLIDAGTTLTIGPGITIKGQNGAVGYSSYFGGSQNVNVINLGTISPSVSGGTITVAGTWVLNQGLFSSVSGGTLTIAATLTNIGTFNATNSAVALGGALTLANLGTFDASGTAVYLTGVLNNTNTTLSVNVLGGAWLLAGGEIDGGAVIATNGASLVASSSGVLNGVTVNGTLDVGSTYDNVILTVTNGLTLNGTALVGNATNQSYGQIDFGGSQTLGGSGTVVFGNNSLPTGNVLRLIDAGTTLTIGPGITIKGQNGAVGYSSYFGGSQNVNVINLGTISPSVSGGTITVQAQMFTNSATLGAQHGTLLLEGSVVVLQPSGTLSIGLSSATDFGSITYDSSVSLNLAQAGTFVVTLDGGYVPNVGTSFQVLHANSSGTFSGAFAGFSSPSGAIWETNYTTTSFVLTNVGQIFWATPANITYGAALGMSQLNASTVPTVSGIFTYNPAEGSILNSGAGQSLTAFFAPSNPSYAPASLQRTITVLEASLGVTANNQTKTYGQTFSFAGTEFTASGLVNGDTVTNASLASAGAISNAPVNGSPYTITITNALGDAGLTNYIISYTNGVLIVDPASLGITANSINKTYGSNVIFAGTEFVSTPLQNNETIGTVTLTSAGAISNAPVSGSPYSIVPSAATGGTFSPGNYAIAYINGTLTVNRAGLMVTANLASRTYGATNPPFSAFYSGFVNGETASVVGGTPGFATPATVTSGVGNYSITPTLGTLTAANYAFVSFINGTLTINPAPLTIASGLAANNKVYDRTTTATLISNNVVLSNVLNGDTISLNTNGYIANFASATVGDSIAVSVNGLTLNGASATNYILTQPAGLAANITAPEIQIFANSPNIIIFWPTNADVFALNQTTNLTPPVAWSPVTNSIAVIGTNNVITVNVGANGDYYYELIAAP